MSAFRLEVRGGEARLTKPDGTVVARPFDATGLAALDVYGVAGAGDAAFDEAAKGLEDRLGAEILDPLAEGAPTRWWLAVDPALEPLPWELLRGGPNRKVLLSTRHALALELPGPPTEPRTGWPLRVLVLVGAKDDDPEVRALDELHRLEVQLDRGDRAPAGGRVRADVQLVVAVRESQLQVAARLAPPFAPDVFHFVGHAGESAEGPALRVELPTGVEQWTPRGIDNLLTPLAQLPRLVVLNACGTARVFGNTSLAATFAAWNVAAVVAMVGPIGGAEAGAFSSELYGRIQAGDDVPEAVRAARDRLTKAAQHATPRWWGVPRLYLRAGTERVLPPVPEARVGARAWLACDLLAPTEWFADRHDLRWRLWSRVLEDGVTIVAGAPRTGRTSLAKVVTERALLAGVVARYVDLRRLEDPTWLTVLQRIRDVHAGAQPLGRIDGPWPKRTFRRFTWLVEALSDPELRVLPTVIGEADPPPAPLPRLRAPIDLGGEPRLVELFRKALEEQAADERVLLVVDHVPEGELFAVEFRERVAPLLLAPPRNVHVVLVLGSEQKALLRNVPGAREVIETRDFLDGTVAEIVRERIAARHPDRAAKLDALLPVANAVRSDPVLYSAFLETFAREP